MKVAKPQVAQRRGIVTAFVGEQEFTFKFGVNTLVAFGQIYTDSPLDFSQQFEKNPIRAFRDMAYCGLLAAAKDNPLPEDFTPETMGEMIDEMAQDQWQQVQTTMMSAMAMGNPALNKPAEPQA